MSSRTRLPQSALVVALVAALIPLTGHPAAAAIGPVVQATAATDLVEGFGFTEGATATLTVDVAANGVGVDHTTDAIVSSGPVPITFDLSGVVDLVPGDTVVLDDGTTTATLVLTAPTQDAFDALASTLYGTATPGATVEVDLGEPFLRRTVAAGDGSWSVDFSLPGADPDEAAVTFLSVAAIGTVREIDAEGDATVVPFSASDPRTTLNYESRQVFVHGFPPSTPVTITIDDPFTAPSPDVTSTLSTSAAPGDALVFGMGQIPPSFVLRPGLTITASDGITTKTLITVQVVVTEVDLDADVVRGTAPAGTLVRVHVHGGCSTRRATADGSGSWIVDFATTGIGACEDAPVDLTPATNGSADVVDDDGDATETWWRPPTVLVDVAADSIAAVDFPFGSTVTVTIDDPDNGVGIDWTSTKLHPYGTSGTQLWFTPWPGPPAYDIQPGDVVTATDGTTTKTLDVDPAFASTYDIGADIVSGTTTAGRSLEVWAFRGGQPWVENAQRAVVADGAGAWSANFASPGATLPESSTHNVRTDSAGFVRAADADGDITQSGWQPPHIEVRREQGGIISAIGWPFGTTVTLTIDDPATGIGVDFTADATSAVQRGLPNNPVGALFTPGMVGYVVPVGATVTIVGVGTTRSTIVSAVAVTDIDAATDTITGTAQPTTSVLVTVNATSAQRVVTTNGAGTWTADFSVPGPNPGEAVTANLTNPPPGVLLPGAAGSSGSARQDDADGDATIAPWLARTPSMMVQYDDSAVLAWQWVPGSSLTLTVDRPSTGLGADVTITQDANGGPYGSSTQFFINDGTFELLPGDVVTITDGTDVRTHTILALAVSGVDVATDIVTGTAAPGSTVELVVWGESGPTYGQARRTMVTSGGGTWSTDLGVAGPNPGEATTYDVLPATTGSVSIGDADGDTTVRQWPRPVPGATIVVDRTLQTVEASGLEPGGDATLTIDDPSTGAGIDFTATVPALRNITFDLAGEYEVRPGALVTVTAGSIVRTHTVVDLMVSLLDVDADTVTGTAPPGTPVRLDVPGPNPWSGATRTVLADGDGIWTVDLSVSSANPYDSPDPHDLTVASRASASTGAAIPVQGDQTRVQVGGPPSTPVTLTATAGDETATVTWTEGFPTGLPTTGYTVTASPGGQTCTTTATTCTVTGLVNGVESLIEVVATNAAGDSTPSGSPLTPSGCVPTGGGAFPDVGGTHPFCGDIEWLVGSGITGGFADGTFRPIGLVTRQAMAAFLYRTVGEPDFTDPVTATFPDVPVTHPFFHEIEWLVDMGITTGNADGTFNPTGRVTRQSMAAFLYRFAGEPAFTDPSTASFADVPISHRFFHEIEWLIDSSVTGGYADGTYHPTSNVTRQAMAAFLHRFVDFGLLPTG